MSILFIIGGATALLFLYYLQKLLKQLWMLRAFKGPPALPIVGNVYTPEATVFMKYLATLRKRYGNIFYYFAFTKPYLVVTEPVIARRVMSDTKTFPKGDDYANKFSIVFGQGLVTSDGERHKNDRAMLGKYFIKVNIVQYMDRMNAICLQSMDQFVIPNEVQNVESMFARMALRVFMNFCMGTDFSSDPAFEVQICKIVSVASNAVGTMIVLNLPNLSIIPYVKTMEKYDREMWACLKPIVEQRKTLMKEGHTFDDPLDVMLKANLSEEDMKYHMATMIGAGHDTTAFFASYCVYCLGQHQSCQDQLRAEIQNVMGDRTDVTGDDLNQFIYMYKVMQEVLRLFAVIPIITRVASEEVFIKEADVTIPKGANVMIPMFLMNRDPEIWDRPNEFVPERFEGKDFTSAKNGFFPFGYGTRTCIGNVLAQMEVAVFLTHILRKYIIEPAPGFKLNIAAGISLTTSNGVKVNLRSIS